MCRSWFVKTVVIQQPDTGSVITFRFVRLPVTAPPAPLPLRKPRDDVRTLLCGHRRSLIQVGAAKSAAVKPGRLNSGFNIDIRTGPFQPQGRGREF